MDRNVEVGKEGRNRGRSRLAYGLDYDAKAHDKCPVFSLQGLNQIRNTSLAGLAQAMPGCSTNTGVIQA